MKFSEKEIKMIKELVADKLEVMPPYSVLTDIGAKNRDKYESLYKKIKRGIKLNSLGV